MPNVGFGDPWHEGYHGLAVLALAGECPGSKSVGEHLQPVIWALLSSDRVVAVWFVVLFIVPREGGWLAAVPAAVLAGIGAARVLTVLVSSVGRSWVQSPKQTAVGAGAAVLLSTYVVLNPAVRIRQMVSADDGLSSEVISAMRWAKQNIPSEGKLVVLSRPQVTEWVPHIARRTVLNSVFGSEWQPHERAQILDLERRLRGCMDTSCVRASVADTIGYDGLYLFADKERLSELTSGSPGQDPVFDVVWQNSEIVIACVSGADEACDSA